MKLAPLFLAKMWLTPHPLAHSGSATGSCDDDSGQLEPVWSNGPVLPPLLADLTSLVVVMNRVNTIMVDQYSDENEPSRAVSSYHEYDSEDFSNVPSCSRCTHV